MKILVVDDNELNLKMLRDILKKYGRVSCVSDGYSAIKKFIASIEKNDRYDLICLDVNMPKIDGIETLSKIRMMEKENQLKESIVFMITASENLEDIFNSFEYKANAFILKDLHTEERIHEEIAKYV